MANDFKLLNEAYDDMTQNVKPLEGTSMGAIPHMLDIVSRLKINQGVAFMQRRSGTNGGIFVEKKILSHEEFGWRIGGWGSMDEIVAEEEEFAIVTNFIKNSAYGDPQFFQFYEVYALMDNEGRQMKPGFHSGDPYDDDQAMGDYEQYGPDPGPRMQDLQ